MVISDLFQGTAPIALVHGTAQKARMNATENNLFRCSRIKQHPARVRV